MPAPCLRCDQIPARDHDHPTVDDYHQVDYQGLHAFLSRTSLRSGLKFPAVNETPWTVKIAFKSVFDDIEYETGPRLPGGKETAVYVFILAGTWLGAVPIPAAVRQGRRLSGSSRRRLS